MHRDGDGGPGHLGRTHHVGLEYVPPQVGVGVDEPRERRGPGGVDHGVEAAEPLDGTGHRPGALGLVAHVAGDGQAVAAGDGRGFLRRSVRRAAKATSAPSRAARIPTARPMPDDPPTTRIRCPCSVITCGSPGPGRRRSCARPRGDGTGSLPGPAPKARPTESRHRAIAPSQTRHCRPRGGVLSTAPVNCVPPRAVVLRERHGPRSVS